MRKYNGSFSFFLLFLLSVSFGGCKSKQTEDHIANGKKINLVLFVVDDMGWKDLEVYGSDFYQTPNIDQLASEGILFDNAYSSSTVCSPSRASLMTGKYPATLNLTDWIEGWKYPKAKLKIPDWTMHLNLSEVTLAEILKEEGYTTAHFGKWHLGEDRKYWPENQGFDFNIGGWSKGSPNKNKKAGSNGYFSPYGNPRLADPDSEEYLTERLASEAVEFIKNHKKNPFFINFWFYNVHTPLQAKEEQIKKYETLQDTTLLQQNATYAAMVEHVDDAVGRVVKQLKEHNLYDSTLIIFTSDNGGLIGNRNNPVTNNYPLRNGKGDIYEGGVRVPLIIKMPSNLNSGTKRSIPVSSIDYFPTVVDLFNIPISEELKKEIDGVSIAPVLQNREASIDRDFIYWHYPHYHIQGATPYSAVRFENWKLIHILESDTYELYNLKNDIGEQDDVSENNLEMTKRLKKKLNNWREKVEAQMPSPNPDYVPKNNSR